MPAAHLKGPTIQPGAHKRGCTGKTGHLSAADAARTQLQYSNLKHRPYQCTHCGLWHNTTKGK